MKLVTHVGFGPGHIVLDGNPAAPPQRGTARNFLPMLVVAKRLDGLRYATWYGLGPGDFVFDGDPSTRRKTGTPTPPNFWPMSIEAKRLEG